MKLAQWMTEQNLTDAKFAALVARDHTTVHRWRLGRTFPDKEGLRAIYKATDGAVTANDFAEYSAEAAE